MGETDSGHNTHSKKTYTLSQKEICAMEKIDQGKISEWVGTGGVFKRVG